MDDLQEMLDDIFSYHAPSKDQLENYQHLREAAKQFALVILELTPACADRSDAIRKVREALMTANAAVALNGKY